MQTDMTTGALERARILVVDDDLPVARMVERFLLARGHHARAVESVREALERLETAPFDLVITDLQMPVSSGLDLLAAIRTRWPETRTIMMSGRAAAADAAVAIEYGVDRLLLKPFELDELRAAVEKALAERRAQQHAAWERERFAALVLQRERESRTWVVRAAHALAAAVEAKDAYTAGHAMRVTTYALEIGGVLGGIDMARFQLAGDLHDVGKIGVPDSVLNKPARLTEDEFALVRKHPEAGERILQPLIDDALVLGVVRSHHERWDGGGYPDGLAGEAIPLPARVLAAADALDAMTSTRAYRSSLSWDVAVSEIRRCAGSQFDPQVVRAFDSALSGLQTLHDAFHAQGHEVLPPPIY